MDKCQWLTDAASILLYHIFRILKNVPAALFICLGCLNVKCAFSLAPAMVVAMSAHCDTVYQKDTNSHFDAAALRPTLFLRVVWQLCKQLCKDGSVFSVTVSVSFQDMACGPPRESLEHTLFT